MTDLERHVHDAAMEESAAYQPSADLPDRIGRRVRARRRRNRALAAGAGLGVAVLAVLALQLPDDDQQGVVVADDPTSTTNPSVVTTTTTSSTTTTTMPSTTTSTAPPPPSLDADTPLTARGVGPIHAGMTLGEAEAASGVTFVTDGFEDFGGYCGYVEVPGQPDLSIRAYSRGPGPVTDPRDAVIAAITIFTADTDSASTRRTDAGVGLGSTEAQVRDAYGGEVEERPHDYVPEGAYLYVHPADAPGFGIRYVLDEHRVVTSIDVGEAEGITAPEGCA